MYFGFATCAIYDGLREWYACESWKIHKEPQHSYLVAWCVPWVARNNELSQRNKDLEALPVGMFIILLAGHCQLLFVQKVVSCMRNTSQLPGYWTFKTNPASCICRKRVGVLILFLLPHWLEVFFWGRQRLFFARLAANLLLERNTTAWYLILLEFQDAVSSSHLWYPWLAFPTPLSSSNFGMINPDHDHCRMIFLKIFHERFNKWISVVISPWPDCQLTFLLG